MISRPRWGSRPALCVLPGFICYTHGQGFMLETATRVGRLSADRGPPFTTEPSACGA
jgi:hypothetical protein